MKALRILAIVAAVGLTGCSQAGTLGDVLGGVLNAPSNQLAGTVQGVDTRAQQVFIRQSDGTTIALSYDAKTEVVYQNAKYPVTALESGDQVTARYQNAGNNVYYTDLIQVTQSVSSNPGGVDSGTVYSLQGTVRQIDSVNGLFTMSTNQGTITVSMPFNPRSSDIDRFRSLRSGDYVRFQGVYLNDTRVELRSFL